METIRASGQCAAPKGRRHDRTREPRHSLWLGRVRNKQDPRSLWLGKMRQRRHPNVVAVALANKNARIAWSLLTSDTVYDASLSVGAA